MNNLIFGGMLLLINFFFHCLICCYLQKKPFRVAAPHPDTDGIIRVVNHKKFIWQRVPLPCGENYTDSNEFR